MEAGAAGYPIGITTEMSDPGATRAVQSPLSRQIQHNV